MTTNAQNSTVALPTPSRVLLEDATVVSLTPLAKHALQDSSAASTYTFGSVLAIIRLQILQVWRFFTARSLGLLGLDPGYGSVVVTD